MSPGVAPNTPEVLGFAPAEHPRGPHSSLPISSSPPVNHVLPHDFNISIPSPKVQPAALQGFAFSVLHMQVHLPTPICSSLRGVVNILASGRAPVSVSKFVAGGSLIALVKNKEGHPLDIRPIVVGEALRRLTGKCLCIITKPKASDFFTPFQYGVAGPDGAEKVIHGVRSCIQEHWKDDNFTVCKVDMSNAFKPCVSAGSPGGMCSPFPRASSLGRLVLWFPPYVMAPSWTIKFRDRGPARGSPGSTSLFLSSAQVGVIHRTGQGLSLSFNRWYLDDGACQDTLRLLPGR